MIGIRPLVPVQNSVSLKLIQRKTLNFGINLPDFENITKCMIKIFRGGRGGDTFETPSPPTNNFCLYPPPVLRCFWKDPLMTPHPPPPHFKHVSLLPPSPSTTPSPPKNFDHAPNDLIPYSLKLV